MIFSLIVMDHTASSVSFKQLHFQGSLPLCLTGPKTVYNETLSSARVIKDYKLLGEPGKLIASLMILQLRDLISFYICHNVGLRKKKIIEELTCFIKLLLHPYNQMGVFIIVILATRHWLTSDTALVGVILSNPCAQPTCFPHQHTLSDLYNH